VLLIITALIGIHTRLTSAQHRRIFAHSQALEGRCQETGLWIHFMLVDYSLTVYRRAVRHYVYHNDPSSVMGDVKVSEKQDIIHHH